MFSDTSSGAVSPLADEARLVRLAFDYSPCLSMVLTPAGVVARVNRAALVLSGLPEVEVAGRSFAGLPWWTDRVAVESALARCVAGQMVRFEAEMAAHRVEYTLTPVFAEGGRLDAMVATGQDIGVRKFIESELREREAVFSLIEENIDDLIAVLDRDGRRIFNSRSYHRVLGDDHVVPGQFSFDAIHPEDRERIRGVFRNVVETGKGVRDEYRYQLADGSIRYIESQSNVISNAQGEVTRVVVIGRDITERRLAEEAFQRIVSLQQAIMRVTTGAIIYVCDRHLHWMNDGWCHMVGYSRQEMEGQSIREFFPSEAAFTAAHSAIYDEAGRARVEPHVVYFRRRDGELFPTLVTGAPFDPARPEMGNVFSLTDITGLIEAQQEIKRLNADLARRVDERTAELQAANHNLTAQIAERERYELALRQSEEKYRLVVEYANEGLAVAQGEFIRFANAKCVELIGSPLEAVYRTPFISFIHPDDRPRIIENYRRRLAGEPVENHYTFRVLRPDGERRWLQISAVAIEWEKQAATLNFLSDVTQRKDAEDALRQSETRFHAMFNNAAVAMSLADPQGRFLEVNDTWARTLGYEVAEFKGMTIFDITHPDERPTSQENMGNLMERRVVSTRMEKRYLRKDGSVVWVDVAVTPIYGLDGKIEAMVGGYVEITERKRAEEEIRRALEKEKELNELKSKFVSMTSHEFRTPLSTILSSSELLEHYADKLSAEDRGEILHSIQMAVSRMTSLLEDVLVIGRVEAGKMQFNPAPLDLGKFCSSLVSEFRLHLAANQRLEFRAGGEFGAAQADEKLLRHILGNLLSNAIKYSPAGGEITFSLTCDNGVACFEVVDQGIGIPAADQERLFETFHRAANVGNISGTGLGLAIVKYAVDLHGGSIAFTSAAGAGARFTVRLPLCREA